MKTIFVSSALVAFLVAGATSGFVPDAGVRFVDTTAKAGIHFQHNSGATGKRYLPETLGSGVAFVDIDGDGWADILFINGKDFTPRGRRSTMALYRNNHNGTFTDVTRGSGLDVELYGFGVAVADYDNDGRVDIYAVSYTHLTLPTNREV